MNKIACEWHCHSQSFSIHSSQGKAGVEELMKIQRLFRILFGSHHCHLSGLPDLCCLQNIKESGMSFFFFFSRMLCMPSWRQWNNLNFTMARWGCTMLPGVKMGNRLQAIDS